MSVSPMSQVLQSIGLTRDDLHRHSAFLRQPAPKEPDSMHRVLDSKRRREKRARRDRPSLDAFMRARDARRTVPDASHPPETPQRTPHYRDYDTLEPPSRARRNPCYMTPSPRSSPFATPSAKPVVNLVSSPGPMGPLPAEDEYDTLPYTLPPGPYSKRKPDLSYAALIGQAVLSSPEHRLTLQEIYDWITLVYPYFQRNESTWMNSIRHVLSTTVAFRKVPRDRSVGRTQWAIWDCDLDCFANGNFRKEFCAEYKQAAAAKKPPPKKRPADDAPSGRKTKRTKKDRASSPAPVPAPFSAPMLPPLVPPTHFLPVFPPCPSAHHQPYYEQLPADVIFPPLPPTSHYLRVTSGAAGCSSALKSPDVPQTSPIPPSSSLPELIPNDGSSSSPHPPSEDPLQTDAADAHVASTPLDPGLSLLDKVLGKQKEVHKTPPKKSRALPPEPTSPTLDRRTRAKKTSVPEPPSTAPPSTPPPRPSTPPRLPGATNTARLSPVRTPLSHKGLHTTPSAGLAHPKTHLDPPHTTFRPDDGINPAVFEAENVRTPSRKRPSHRDREPMHVPPVTPKKLVFPTPGSLGASPMMRTPGARIFDPHDPGALLDDEFARLGRGVQESPVGFFDRRGLLYESPELGSPGKLPRWY